ncbi:MAG TPA: malto-oligosyltrehalose synthase [Gemmatimonadaceae bacterium]|nr:malto-oligosyltrehalose synthase [Gemmatimonadaceae bacterium]
MTSHSPLATRHSFTATYRVQLNKQFTLNDARRVVPYLDRLGISHLYCSPILAARPGSTHGYDVVDPTRVNPEIGTLADLRALAGELQARGMGILLDIVPNHMGIGPANAYWEDVLAHGLHSRYAAWFDIDWRAGDNKIVLPVLRAELDAVLARGELSLDLKGKTPRLRYFESSWPVDPATLPEELQLAKFDSIAVADPKIFLSGGGGDGRERLRSMLEAQHYRLCDWKRSTGEINYRRFFDLNDLVAIRQEDPEVFSATHDFVLSLVGEGVVHGLRVDHIDGLLDPLGYLERLREEVERRVPRRDGDEPFPIVVEKILSPGETLREGWPVQGTTGYEFLNDVENLFLDASGYAAIDHAYRAMRRLTNTAFADVARAGKVGVLEGALRADVARLVPAMRALTGTRHSSDATLEAGIVRFIAGLPVYRTYVDGNSPTPHPDDVAVVRRAVENERCRSPEAPAPEVESIGEVVLGHIDGPERLTFVQRLQQTSGPATAKGVEDTALYVYVPLLSRNEVGGGPARPLDDAVGRFHRANTGRACRWPSSLTCVNTHDTKRSADLRARLDVLTECAADWRRGVARWRRLNHRHRSTVKGRLAPDTNTEYVVYQTLIGIWPTPRPGRRADDLPDRAWFDSARTRLEQYMLKAVREAKTRTSWTDPDEAYETALRQFLTAVLAGGDDEPFLTDVARFVSRIAALGNWNALARVVLQMTAPGVPDTYQGDELWNFALVDPDNRRPVDYGRRGELLEGGVLESLRELHPSDERFKLGILQRLLNIRRNRAALFGGGSYSPLEVRGAFAEHLIAFARSTAESHAIVVAPRLLAPLVGHDGTISDWGDTEIVLPKATPRGSFRELFSGAEVRLSDDNASLSASSVLKEMPLAVLLSP